MAKMTHTPGPWTIEDPLGPETLWIVEAGKEPHEWRCIAMVCRGDQEIAEAEQQANAHLIAAAADTAAECERLRTVNAELVAVAKSALHALECQFGVSCARINFKSLYEAIAKAEGR